MAKRKKRRFDLLDDRLRSALNAAGYQRASVAPRHRERGQERGCAVYEQSVQLSTHPGHAFVLRLYCAPPFQSAWGHSLGVYAVSLLWQVRPGELLLVADLWEDAVAFAGVLAPSPWFVSGPDEWNWERAQRLVALESYGPLFSLPAARCTACEGPCPQGRCWRALPSPARAPEPESDARRPRKPKIPLTSGEVATLFTKVLADKTFRGPRDALLLAAACVTGGRVEDLVAIERSALRRAPGDSLLDVLELEVEPGEWVKLPLPPTEFDWASFLQDVEGSGSPFLFVPTDRGGRRFDVTKAPALSASAASRAMRNHTLKHAKGAGVADLHHWWSQGTLGAEATEPDLRAAEANAALAWIQDGIEPNEEDEDLLTLQELRDRRDAGEFDPDRWNWCVSEELRRQDDGEYKAEWSVWVMGQGAEQCYGVIWCADEAEARAICREFGVERPLQGVG